MKRMMDPYCRWALLTKGRYLLRDSSGRVRLMLGPRRGYEGESVIPLNGGTLVPTRSSAPEKYFSAWIENPSELNRSNNATNEGDFCRSESLSAPCDGSTMYGSRAIRMAGLRKLSTKA